MNHFIPTKKTKGNDDKEAKGIKVTHRTKGRVDGITTNVNLTLGQTISSIMQLITKVEIRAKIRR